MPASFIYDATGRRASKTINGAVTSFLYDGVNSIQELAGTATANLLTGLGTDEYFIRTDTSGASALLTDALGSTVALTDPSGGVQTQYTYEPFGATTTIGAATGNPIGYTGRENDGTGLYYYRARYYHPGFARFLQQDPIGSAGGMNFYAYVRNNPTDNTDPLGLCAITFTTQGGTQDGFIMAQTNDGSKIVGPFPATNRALGSGPIPKGTYPIGSVRRYGYQGTPTPRGLEPFDVVNGQLRTRQQAFGDAFIEVNNVPAGRNGIGIHAKYPDPPALTPNQLKGTIGCIRTRNQDINELADFFEGNCKNETNYLTKQ